jgi:hypothetical protein
VGGRLSPNALEEAMLFFPMLFWLAVIFFFMHSAQRRRWRRWAMMEHGMLPPYPTYAARDRALLAARRPPPADDPTLVEQLESRIAELEQRLEFTERLLAERRG